MVAMLTHSLRKKLCCLLVSLSLLHMLRFDLGLGRYFANGPCSDTKTSVWKTLKAGDNAHLNHQRVAVCVTGQLRTLTLDPKDPSYPKAWGPMSTRNLPEANISVAESIQQNLYPQLVATTSTTTELDVFMYVSTRERNEHEPKVGNLSACMPLRPRIKNGNLFCHVVREEDDLPYFPNWAVWQNYNYKTQVQQVQLLRQLKDIHTCYKMVQKHSFQNNIQYDWLVRLRPDFHVLQIPPLEKLAQEIAATNRSRIWFHSKSTCCCGNEDIFAIAQYSSMGQYMERYLWAQMDFEPQRQYLWKNRWTSEAFLKQLVEEHGIQLEEHPDIHGCLVKPKWRGRTGDP